MLHSIIIIIIIISFKCSGPWFWPLGVRCALEFFKFYEGVKLWKTLSVYEAVIHNQTHSNFCIETWTVTPSGILKTIYKQCHISLDQVMQPNKFAANLENKSKSKTKQNKQNLVVSWGFYFLELQMRAYGLWPVFHNGHHESLEASHHCSAITDRPMRLQISFVFAFWLCYISICLQWVFINIFCVCNFLRFNSDAYERIIALLHGPQKDLRQRQGHTSHSCP